MAAPAFAATNEGSGASGTSVVVTKTGSTGNLQIVNIAAALSSTTCTPPAGWKYAPRMGGTAGVGPAPNLQHFVFYKFVEAGDAATYTFTLGGSSAYAWTNDAFSNVHAELPFASAKRDSSSGSSTYSITGTYVPLANCLAYHAQAGYSTSAAPDPVMSAGDSANMTRRSLISQGASSVYVDNWTNSADAAAVDASRDCTATVTPDGASGSSVWSQVCLMLVSADASYGAMTPVWEITKGNLSAATDHPLGAAAADVDRYVPGLKCILMLANDNSEANSFSAVGNLNGSGDATQYSGSPHALTGTDVLQTNFWYKTLLHTDCTRSSTGGNSFNATSSVSCDSSFYALCYVGSAVLADVTLTFYDETSNTTTPNPPSAGTCVIGDVVLAGIAQRDLNTAGTVSSGYTERVDFGASGGPRFVVGSFTCIADGVENPGTFSALTSDQATTWTMKLGGVVATVTVGGFSGWMTAVMD